MQEENRDAPMDFSKYRPPHARDDEDRPLVINESASDEPESKRGRHENLPLLPQLTPQPQLPGGPGLPPTSTSAAAAQFLQNFRQNMPWMGNVGNPFNLGQVCFDRRYNLKVTRTDLG